MYFCIKCKQQFGDAMTRYGECPFCSTINMVAQKRIESNNLFKNSDEIEKILSRIKRRKSGG